MPKSSTAAAPDHELDRLGELERRQARQAAARAQAEAFRRAFASRLRALAEVARRGDPRLCA